MNKFLRAMIVALLCLCVSLGVHAQDFNVLEYDNAGLANNDVPTWDGGSSKWVVEDPATAIGGNMSIDDLSDVALTAPTLYEVLAYNDATSAWEDADLAALISNTTAIDDLSDVVITTPATGSVIYWNGANWVDSTVSGILNSFPPTITDYTPSLGVGGGTWTSTTINEAYYQQVANHIMGYVDVTGTCGSTPQSLRFNLPFAIYSTDFPHFQCAYQDSATSTTHGLAIAIGSQTVAVYPADTINIASFADGTCRIFCTLNYLRAS